MSTNIAILGTAHGHVYHLADCAKRVAGAKLLGVYDEDPTRRANASAKIGIPGTGDIDELLKQRPALVIIDAVPSDRVDLALKAIAAGAAVLVDKPLALSHAALDRLIAGVDKHKKPVIAYYPYRGTAQIMAAKAMLDSGKIGKLVRVMSCGPHKLNPGGRPSWHFSAEQNGGALIDIGSHHLDVCCWLAGAAPIWLSALHANFDQPTHTGFQDFAQTQFRFPGGAFGHVEVDWLNPASMKNFGDTRTWIQGTKGKIEVRLGDVHSAEYWTHEVAAQPLDVAPYADVDTWTIQLMTDLATGKPGYIPQADVWRASRATLYAFDSARQNGKPLDGMIF